MLLDVVEKDLGLDVLRRAILIPGYERLLLWVPGRSLGSHIDVEVGCDAPDRLKWLDQARSRTFRPYQELVDMQTARRSNRQTSEAL